MARLGCVCFAGFQGRGLPGFGSGPLHLFAPAREPVPGKELGSRPRASAQCFAVPSVYYIGATATAAGGQPEWKTESSGRHAHNAMLSPALAKAFPIGHWTAAVGDTELPTMQAGNFRGPMQPAIARRKPARSLRHAGSRGCALRPRSWSGPYASILEQASSTSSVASNGVAQREGNMRGIPGLALKAGRVENRNAGLVLPA